MSIIFVKKNRKINKWYIYQCNINLFLVDQILIINKHSWGHELVQLFLFMIKCYQ